MGPLVERPQAAPIPGPGVNPSTADEGIASCNRPPLGLAIPHLLPGGSPHPPCSCLGHGNSRSGLSPTPPVPPPETLPPPPPPPLGQHIPLGYTSDSAQLLPPIAPGSGLHAPGSALPSSAHSFSSRPTDKVQGRHGSGAPACPTVRPDQLPASLPPTPAALLPLAPQ